MSARSACSDTRGSSTITVAPRVRAISIMLKIGVHECFRGLWPKRTMQPVLARSGNGNQP
jgi:hypothetical protein